MPDYGFSLTRIFPYSGIFYVVKNKGKSGDTNFFHKNPKLKLMTMVNANSYDD